MIIEVAIVSAAVSSVIISSLAFASRVLKQRKASFAERRRILERQRGIWYGAARDPKLSEARVGNMARWEKVEKDLIELAKEEAAE